MGETLLYAAVGKSIPLVEVNLLFVEDIDCAAATAQLNTLAEDFHLDHLPYYGNPRLRVGSATKEALEGLFGWRIKRVPLPRYDEATKTWGHWPDTYLWKEVSPVTCYPIEGIIHSIGISQPGADDNGQWYE